MNNDQAMQFPAFTRKFLVAFIVGVMMTSSVYAKKEDLPEVSKDGLHLMKGTKAEVVYVKPGATINQYTKVKILDCFVQFKKNWERDYNLNEVGLSGRVTDKDAENIKQKLAAEFKKVFTRELTKGGHEVVDEVGPDVLLLRPAILNLDVTAPDVMTVGIETTWVASAGEMTLYMEMYDSATSTLLARVIDAEAGNQGGMAMASSEFTNRAAADRILSYWAGLLNKHLDTVSKNPDAK